MTSQLYLNTPCVLILCLVKTDRHICVKYRILTLTVLQSASDILTAFLHSGFGLLITWNNVIPVPCPWTAPEHTTVALVLVVTFRIMKAHSFFFFFSEQWNMSSIHILSCFNLYSEFVSRQLTMSQTCRPRQVKVDSNSPPIRWEVILIALVLAWVQVPFTYEHVNVQESTNTRHTVSGQKTESLSEVRQCYLDSKTFRLAIYPRARKLIETSFPRDCSGGSIFQLNWKEFSPSHLTKKSFRSCGLSLTRSHNNVRVGDSIPFQA